MSNDLLLKAVAAQLGPDLLRDCAFVGGCTVHLYLDDPSDALKLRATLDVDIIVEVQPSSIIGYQNFADRIKARGFQEQAMGGPMCRFRTADELILDVMATDERVLQFGNKWYKAAFDNAQPKAIGDGIQINVIRLEHFFATKFTSWSDRGGNDLMHRDAEDILTVIDGVMDIESRLEEWPTDLKQHVRSGMVHFRDHHAFDFYIQGNLAVYQDSSRIDAAYSRWNNMILRLQL